MKEFLDLLPNLSEKEIAGVEQYLLQVAQEKFKKEKLSDYFTWVKAVWVTAKGEPLDFERHKYLVGIYQDQFPNIVCIKSSQMGLTERTISEAVWIAEQIGKIVLYTFPTERHLQDLVQARLNPVLNLSEYLRSKIDASSYDDKVEKLGLKKIGKGYIYFRGSQNAKQIITIDADCIILDERDRFAEENVPFIEKRLLASNLKWRREISTPTFPNIGVHVSYLASDQRIWQVQCKKCNMWQTLDFFKNIDFDKKIAYCLGCKKEIDRLADGRWYITHSENSAIHGYYINGLFNPMTTLEEMIERYRRASNEGFSALQQFFNQDLGMPYEVEGMSIRVSELDACKRNYLMPVQEKKNCYAGVDVGVNVHHCIVLEKLNETKTRLIWAGTVKNFTGPFDSIESLMRRFELKGMVIDKKPEVQKVHDLMDMFPRKVYACEYPPNAKFSIQEYYIFDDVKCEVRLDRTISLDYLVSDIQNQNIELPQNIESIENFYNQIRSSTRVIDKNKKTTWIEKGSDHYFHALNYARIAQIRSKLGKALLDYYGKPDEGFTPNLIDWLRVRGERIF